MSLKDEIRNRFQSDVESILESHLDDVEGMFQFLEDDAIELADECREASVEAQILLYLIARRYQAEAELVDTKSIEYPDMYGRFPEKDESTIRGYFMNLRNNGFARKSEEGHELVVERLPEAIDRIVSEISDQ